MTSISPATPIRCLVFTLQGRHVQDRRDHFEAAKTAPITDDHAAKQGDVLRSRLEYLRLKPPRQKQVYRGIEEALAEKGKDLGQAGCGPRDDSAMIMENTARRWRPTLHRVQQAVR